MYPATSNKKSCENLHALAVLGTTRVLRSKLRLREVTARIFYQPIRHKSALSAVISYKSGCLPVKY